MFTKEGSQAVYTTPEIYVITDYSLITDLYGNKYTNAPDVTVVTSVQGAEMLGIDQGYEQFYVYLNGECDEAVNQEVTQLLTTVGSGVDYYHVLSDYADNAALKEQYYTAITMITSVAVLLFSVCAGMINNSVTARIRDGRRQIGTLRAVGASQRELVRSYALQLLSFFKWGLAGGFILYVAATQLYNLILQLSDKDYYPRLQLTIWQPLLFAALLTAVCFINLWLKVRSETEHSIVENIREL